MTDPHDLEPVQPGASLFGAARNLLESRRKGVMIPISSAMRVSSFGQRVGLSHAGRRSALRLAEAIRSAEAGRSPGKRFSGRALTCLPDINMRIPADIRNCRLD